MQGLITLDFGNTNPHAGLFRKVDKKWSLIKVVPFQELALYLDQLKMTPDNSSIVNCEVKAREEELQPLIEQGFLLTRVRDYWRGERFAGMKVNYAKSLGEDRLILAHYRYKTQRVPTLIIDAGTYLTFDIVNEEGFQGGYIIPGEKSYFSSFSQGEQLKDIPLTLSQNEELPHTTAEAMAGGYKAFASFARELIKEHSIGQIITTGGNASHWQKLATQNEPHLIHLALHHWMTTQIEPL
jgi:pantothenate kinase type III